MLRSYFKEKGETIILSTFRAALKTKNPLFRRKLRCSRKGCEKYDKNVPLSRLFLLSTLHSNLEEFKLNVINDFA